MFAALFLLTHLEFFAYLKEWIGVLFGIGSFVYVRYTNNNKELETKMKSDKQKFDDRLVVVEKNQEKHIPKFTEVCDSMKHVNEIVLTTHELRFTGIVNDIANMRDKHEIRFQQTEKVVDGFARRFEKIEDKLDKIMEELIKINMHQK